jgi:HK97 family phage major capsid protein
MIEKVLELRSQIADLLDGLTATEAKADEEKRELTDNEKTVYAETMQKIKTMRGKEQRLIELHGLEDELRDLLTSKATDHLGDPGQPKADEQEWRSNGEFLMAVARAGMGHGLDQRLVRATEERQSGLNEGVGSEGGFLVKTDFSTEMIKRTYELSALANRVRKIGVSANSNGLSMYGIDENNRATGSRWGGVRGYWLHEAGTKTETQPAFRKIELKLNKLIGLCYATDELLQDTTALESIIQQAFSEEFAWLIDDAILRGTGVGQPLGILNSPALVTVQPEVGQAANTIIYENVLNMRSRMWGRSRGNSQWYISQDTEPQLHTMSYPVGAGGVPVYMPAGGASADPYDRLFARPVVPIEQASSLGTVGDINVFDLSQYLMIDKGGIQSASSIHVRFVNDEQCFRFVYRVDGQPMWNAPLTPANAGPTLSPFVTLATRP